MLKKFVIASLSLVAFSASAASPQMSQLKDAVNRLRGNIATLIPADGSTGPAALSTANMAQNCQVATNINSQLANATAIAHVALNVANVLESPILNSIDTAASNFAADTASICAYAQSGADPTIAGKGFELTQELTKIKGWLDMVSLGLNMIAP